KRSGAPVEALRGSCQAAVRQFKSASNGQYTSRGLLFDSPAPTRCLNGRSRAPQGRGAKRSGAPVEALRGSCQAAVRQFKSAGADHYFSNSVVPFWKPHVSNIAKRGPPARG